MNILVQKAVGLILTCSLRSDSFEVQGMTIQLSALLVSSEKQVLPSTAYPSVCYMLVHQSISQEKEKQDAAIHFTIPIWLDGHSSNEHNKQTPIVYNQPRL